MYSDNYTGPYYSDGKYQESVPFGDAPADTPLAQQSRLHDTAYYYYKDDLHRKAADEIYYNNLKDIDDPATVVARNAVRHGNVAVDAGSRLAHNVAVGTNLLGPLGAIGGLVYTGLQNIHKASQMLPGGAYDKAKSDVLSLYATDPKANMSLRGSAKKPTKPIDIPVPPTGTSTTSQPVYDPYSVASNDPTHAPAVNDKMLYFGDPAFMSAWQKHRRNLYKIQRRRRKRVYIEG